MIDGEAVMERPDGITDFFALHAALAARSAVRAFLYAFDLQHLNGDDLRDPPLDERRPLLVDVPGRAPPALRFSEHVLGDELAVYRAACEFGPEGIAAKVREAPYRSGPNTTWLTIKCATTGTFVSPAMIRMGEAASAR